MMKQEGKSQVMENSCQKALKKKMAKSICQNFKQNTEEAKHKFLKSHSFIIFSFNKLQYIKSQGENMRLRKSSF